MKKKRKKRKKRMGSLMDGLGMDFASTEKWEGGRYYKEQLSGDLGHW